MESTVPTEPPPAPDFTVKTSLAGDLVRLVPATREHAATLHGLLADPEVGRLTGSVHTSDAGPAGAAPAMPWSVVQLEEIYERWSRADDRLVWVIEERSSGELVGESVLHELDEDNLACGFRIWISGARDRGLGTEAVELTIRHAFEDQHLHRVGLEVYDFNPRARHVYEKAGFVLEGTMREALRFDGHWVDCHVMGLLAREWHALTRR
ncbi:MAG: GNAT family protein [Micrococcus sp.]|nr:GNAT family protein [Micrococcus sp.]